MYNRTLRYPVKILSILAVCLLPFANAQPANPPRRLALLIANGAYKPLPPIPAAAKELALMKSVLADAAFDISSVENTSFKTLADAANKFIDKVQPGDICLLYFSGYAIQAEDNNDFLLPI